MNRRRQEKECHEPTWATVAKKKAAASPFELCWLASVLRILGGGHGVLVERGYPFLSFVPPCGFASFDRIFNALN